MQARTDTHHMQWWNDFLWSLVTCPGRSWPMLPTSRRTCYGAKGQDVLRVSGSSVCDITDRHCPSRWCIQPVCTGTGLTLAHNQRSYDQCLYPVRMSSNHDTVVLTCHCLGEAKLKFHFPSHSLAGRWICGRTEFATRAPNSLPQRLHLKLTVTK